MSVARPARALVGRCIASTRNGTTTPVVSHRHLHSSTPRCARPKSRFRNVKAEDLGLTTPEGAARYQKETLPTFTEEELEELSTKYTPEQLEAIRLGEKAIDTKDLIMQGRLREDMFRPTYKEDLRTLDPEIDLKQQHNAVPTEAEWASTEEYFTKYEQKMTEIVGKSQDAMLTRTLARAMRSVKATPIGQETLDLTEGEIEEMLLDPELAKKYILREDGPVRKPGEKGPEFMTQGQALRLDEAIDEAWEKEITQLAKGDMSELKPTAFELASPGPDGSVRIHSAYSNELRPVPGVAELRGQNEDPEDEGKDPTGKFTELKRMTDMSLKEIQSIYVKILVRRYVTNQTRLGKLQRSSILVVAGNGNGRIGLGVAKSVDASTAAQTATALAIRNMKPIRRYENRTIYGKVSAKISGTVVELETRPPGFGLRVPERFFELFRAAGLHDMSAKMPRSKNPLNSVKAAYHALMNQPDPEQIAIGRGKKLVDARKVYYGGSVY